MVLRAFYGTGSPLAHLGHLESLVLSVGSGLSFDVLVQVGVDIEERQHVVWQVSYPLYIWCFLTVEEGNVRPLG